LIAKHLQHTESTVAQRILNNWNAVLPQFIKVYPTDYRRVMEEAESVKSTEELPVEEEVVSETITADGN